MQMCFLELASGTIFFFGGLCKTEREDLVVHGPGEDYGGSDE